MKNVKFIIPCTLALLFSCSGQPESSVSSSVSEGSASSQSSTTSETSNTSAATSQSVTSETSDTSVTSITSDTSMTSDASQASITSDASDSSVDSGSSASSSDSVSSATSSEEEQPEITINSLSAPSFMSKRAARIATLDDVATIETNENPHRNTYYADENDGVALHRIGTNNPFKFQTSARSVDEDLDETDIINPALVITGEIKGEEGYEEIDTLSDYLSFEEGEIQLTELAAGNTFKLTFEIDETVYSEVYADPIVFEFEALDGYNVYDAKELSVFDNRSTRGQNTSGVIVDPWAEIKAEKGLTDLAPKAVILQDDISITMDDIPSSFAYSVDEINAYVGANPTDFADWIALKNATSAYENSPLDSETAKTLLIGSMKDYTTVYERVTNPDDEFIFDGNYFTLDTSALSKIYAFDLAIESSKLSHYQEEDGSHGQLFGYNSQDTQRYAHTLDQLGGKELIRNMTVIGNGERSSNDDNMGGLMTYKVDTTKAYFENVITSKTFMTFMGEKWSNDTLNMAELHIDRCKSFDSYNSMLYFWGNSGNTVTNSFFKGAGGAIFLLDEVNAHDTTATLHGTPDVSCENVYFENYVSGQEPWFQYNNATALVTAMSAIGASTGWIGKNATLGQGNTITKVIDGVPYINIIAIDMCGGSPLGNSKSNGTPLAGRFSIKNSEETLLADTDMAAFNSFDAENPYANPFMLYENLVEAVRDAEQALVFGSTISGGHGFTAADADAGFNEGMTFNISKVEQVIQALGGNVPGELQQYFSNGFVPVVGVGEALNTCMLPELAQASYLSGYIKAAANTNYLSVTLGTNSIND